MADIYITVCPLKSKFDQLLTYKLPISLLESIDFKLEDDFYANLIGLLVLVPLGKANKLQVAIIVAKSQLEDRKINIKQVADFISLEPVLNVKQLKLAKLIAWRYQCSLAHALSLFLLPKQLQKKKTLALDAEKSSILDALNAKTVKVSKINKKPKYQRYIDKIIAELTEEEKAKLLVEPPLTQEQNRALKQIELSREREFLIHGVTGSGKTELYLRLAKDALLNNKTCLILVPEINLSYPMIQAFSLRFPQQCGIWHSQMSEGEKLSCREAIQNSHVKILIGTRSALFSNLDNIGLIVIDEEHDSSYQSETIPHYQAKSIARLLLRDHLGAKLLLASATPAISTYYRAKQGKCSLIELKQRVFSVNLPQIDLVDLRQESKLAKDLILADRTIQAITNVLNLNQQVLLLLNRRGYNVCYLCQACGVAIKCADCDFRLVYHQSIAKLLCHYCGKTYALPKTCPNCSQAKLVDFGFGTEKLAEYLQAKWPNIKIARLDQDVSQKKSKANEILAAFKRGEYQILLGTQMIAKGHDFNNIGLVAILAVDSMLAMPDYQAEERCFQLITQAAGRAGRQGQASKVLLQTFDPDQACLQVALRNDYKAFYEQQLILRKRLALPPFMAMGLIKLQFTQKNLSIYELKEISQSLYKDLQVLCRHISREQNAYSLTIWPLGNHSIRKINQEYSLTIRVSSQFEAAIAYLCHKLLKQKTKLKARLSLYLAN